MQIAPSPNERVMKPKTMKRYEKSKRKLVAVEKRKSPSLSTTGANKNVLFAAVNESFGVENMKTT